MPMRWAAAFERSITRPFMNGPRSLMRTTTDLPFFGLVTLSLVPNGRVLCAAVKLAGFMRSPFAVLEVNAYHDAVPQPEAAKAGEDIEKAAVSAAAVRIDFMCSGLTSGAKNVL